VTQLPVSPLDTINRRTWKRRGALRGYGSAAGFSDPGEEVAFGLVTQDARAGRMLDLGVGGGRTTPIVLAETKDYVGLDYTAELIEICRRKFPGIPFVCADARDLSQFPDDCFNLVQFSFNGINSVDRDGRKRVFGEVFRVLRPGGAFLFSTFVLDNLNLTSKLLTLRKVSLSKNKLPTIMSLARYLASAGLGLWRRATYRKFERTTADEAVLLHEAHDYGFLMHSTTFSALCADLAERGFSSAPRFIGYTGAEISKIDDSKETYFHVIARKP
jgi:SAM-dependent methyltransferase